MNYASLRGITWNHSRALPPLVATAQRFEELHPDIRIQWEKRSLHEFGHADIATLAQNFDLLVIDHPMAGDAEETGALTDLLPFLSSREIKELQEDSIGPSFTSYLYHDKLYALPIDAAAPSASFRPDLLKRHNVEIPVAWKDLIALARLGCVRMPAFCADLFLNFMGLCVSRGCSIASESEKFVDHEIGANCLEMLCELAALMPREIYQMNPIALYEQMGSADNIAYCPFAYTYSNYSRCGFGSNHIRFANPVTIDGDRPMRTILGGTGIAISATCKDVSIALQYGLFVAGEICQRTIYGQCGGQPARKSAWGEPLLNQITDDFFVRTVDSIERAYVRPRYAGYVAFQERAGEAIVDLCKHHGNVKKTLEQLDALYRSSQREGKQHV